MSNKRKKFIIAEDLSRGLTEVINAVHNNTGSLRYEVIALSRIEVDPNNPRELLITDKEINLGIDANDLQLVIKQKEKEDLASLAQTIRENGIINPIMVYKHHDKYRILAGERRFLAAHLAGKNDIHARVIDKKPDEINLRLLQWVENNERKNLTLHERLKNLEAIIEAYNTKHSNHIMTTEILGNLTGLSNTQSHYYLTILNSDGELRKNIENNSISSFDKAAFIASISDNYIRNEAIQAAIRGESMQVLKKMVTQSKLEKKVKLLKSTSTEKRGRTAQYVNLGKVKDIDLVKKIIDIVISHPNYSKYVDEFNVAGLDECKQVSLAFHKLLMILSNK